MSMEFYPNISGNSSNRVINSMKRKKNERKKEFSKENIQHNL
jgi:hypothetical protein